MRSSLILFSPSRKKKTLVFPKITFLFTFLVDFGINFGLEFIVNYPFTLHLLQFIIDTRRFRLQNFLKRIEIMSPEKN